MAGHHWPQVMNSKDLLCNVNVVIDVVRQERYYFAAEYVLNRV